MSNNWPHFAHHPDHSSALGPHQLPPAVGLGGAGAPASWADEFLDFAAARRGGHRRRSASDSVAFLGAPLADQCPGFDRLDDDQLLSMFSDEVPPPSSSSAGVPVSSTSTPSDHDSVHEGKLAAGPEEAQSVCKTEADASALAPPAAGSEPILDPKRRSRVRKLQYISELERSVTTLQARRNLLLIVSLPTHCQVSLLTVPPSVARRDEGRSVGVVSARGLPGSPALHSRDGQQPSQAADRSTGAGQDLQGRVCGLCDAAAHQEALKKEVERLKQVYHQQNVDEMATSTSEPVGLAEKELID
ncbi:hypothetical protein B296_00039153 [Ensete ventricosum]|uniref:BZIP domain-containing protein n=1 Tax=Ensete ventricosum TaxID=4639 RepID=A0A426XNK6_ENSVE|nr:hypothetical protein B296_00039153 [Ensete ventricosum]